MFFRPEGGGRPCQGSERRYQACSASQCLNVPRMIVREFAVQICERAKEVDSDLTGAGLQRQSSDGKQLFSFPVFLSTNRSCILASLC